MIALQWLTSHSESTWIDSIDAIILSLAGNKMKWSLFKLECNTFESRFSYKSECIKIACFQAKPIHSILNYTNAFHSVHCVIYVCEYYCLSLYFHLKFNVLMLILNIKKNLRAIRNVQQIKCNTYNYKAEKIRI